jgi:fructoselysine and glucoselysine-specific PTS system IIA component
MKKILVAAHGILAEALVKSISMIAGEQENVTAFNFYADDDKKDWDAVIRNYFDALAEDDELLICADMFYGSVNQKFLPYLDRQNVHLVTGVNLPALIELVTMEGEFTRENIEECLTTAHEELFYVDIDQIAKKKGNKKNEEGFF